MTSKQIIDSALNLYHNEARQCESDAGHSGSFTDGGCSRMLGLIAAYNCGRNNQIPDWLEPYIVEANNLLDPEYQTYIRLQKKFGKS